jgi:hypothetical protein
VGQSEIEGSWIHPKLKRPHRHSAKRDPDRRHSMHGERRSNLPSKRLTLPHYPCDAMQRIGK